MVFHTVKNSNLLNPLNPMTKKKDEHRESKEIFMNTSLREKRNHRI